MNPDYVVLHDGRKLAYADYSPTNVLPLFLCHGTPGSHIQPNSLINAANNLGIRWIVPCRPGYSLSDPRQGYNLFNIAEDIVELADTLGIGRFGIMGTSGGGPYTLATAQRFPERLLVVGSVSSVAPPQGDVPNAESLRANIEKDIKDFHAKLLSDPEGFFNAMLSNMVEIDRKILEIHREWFFATCREALHQGSQGQIDDVVAFATDWGFSLESIQSKVYLWCGDKDNLFAGNQLIAERLPDCVTNYIPDVGHLLPDSDFIGILETLAEEMRKQLNLDTQ